MLGILWWTNSSNVNASSLRLSNHVLGATSAWEREYHFRRKRQHYSIANRAGRFAVRGPQRLYLRDVDAVLMAPLVRQIIRTKGPSSDYKRTAVERVDVAAQSQIDRFVVFVITPTADKDSHFCSPLV
jgi:hypothetical protein